MNNTIFQLFGNLEENLFIVTVTRSVDLNFEFKKFYKDGKLNDMLFFYDQAEFETSTLSKEFMIKIFNKLKSMLEKIENKIVFIIFNEHFFGKRVCNLYDKKYLYSFLKEFSNQFKSLHLFFFINVLFEENNLDIKNLEIYQQDFKIDDLFFCPCSSRIKKIKYNEDSLKYSNSTLIIYNGEPIIKYKKSSFANEIFDVNYCFGFGNFEFLENNEISKEISKHIQIYICMDVTIASYFPLIKKLNFSFCKDPFQLKTANEIKTLLTNNSTSNINDKKKKIIIVQSNSIELNGNLDILDDNVILVQVDPKNTFVSKIKYNAFVKNRIKKMNEKYDYLKKRSVSMTILRDNDQQNNHYLFMNELNYFKYMKTLLRNNVCGISKSLDTLENIIIQNNDKGNSSYVELSLYSIK